MLIDFKKIPKDFKEHFDFNDPIISAIYVLKLKFDEIDKVYRASSSIDWDYDLTGLSEQVRNCALAFKGSAKRGLPIQLAPWSQMWFRIWDRMSKDIQHSTEYGAERIRYDVVSQAVTFFKYYGFDYEGFHYNYDFRKAVDKFNKIAPTMDEYDDDIRENLENCIDAVDNATFTNFEIITYMPFRCRKIQYTDEMRDVGKTYLSEKNKLDSMFARSVFVVFIIKRIRKIRLTMATIRLMSKISVKGVVGK